MNSRIAAFALYVHCAVDLGCLVFVWHLYTIPTPTYASVVRIVLKVKVTIIKASKLYVGGPALASRKNCLFKHCMHHINDRSIHHINDTMSLSGQEVHRPRFWPTLRCVFPELTMQPSAVNNADMISA